MMRKLFIVTTLLVILLFGLSTSFALAQPSSYTSCFQLQNLESTTASVTIQYYAQGNGTPVASPSDTINGNSSKTYCPLSAVSSGFNGSVVVQSTTPLAAITNVSGNSSFGTYNASYSGFTGGSSQAFLPLLFKGNFGYNTFFNVQNVDSSKTATVSVAYSDGTSAGPVNIGPGQSFTFDQAKETHSQAVFAGTVTSTGGSPANIVATVLEVGPNNQPMNFAYNGFTSTSNKTPVMPLVQANNFGFTSGIQIQNTSGSATSVTVTYSPSTSGTACTQTKSIPGNSSETFALTAWASNDANSDNNCTNGQTFVGSARVTTNSGNAGLNAIVNQHNFSTNKGASYGAFDPSAGSKTVVMPLIMDRNFGYFTGFNIQNVGSSATSVNCTFSGTGVTAATSSPLQPGQAFTAVQLNQISNGYVGSATCTATGGDEKIIGIVNELLNAGTQDTFLVYEASNK